MGSSPIFICIKKRAEKTPVGLVYFACILWLFNSRKQLKLLAAAPALVTKALSH